MLKVEHTKSRSGSKSYLLSTRCLLFSLHPATVPVSPSKQIPQIPCGSKYIFLKYLGGVSKMLPVGLLVTNSTSVGC